MSVESVSARLLRRAVLLATALCASAGMSATSVRAGSAGATAPVEAYPPSSENLTARQWFQDAKFGIFLHWGLYSELGGAGKMGIAEWVVARARVP